MRAPAYFRKRGHRAATPLGLSGAGDLLAEFCVALLPFVLIEHRRQTILRVTIGPGGPTSASGSG